MMIKPTFRWPRDSTNLLVLPNKSCRKNAFAQFSLKNSSTWQMENYLLWPGSVMQVVVSKQWNIFPFYLPSSLDSLGNICDLWCPLPLLVNLATALQSNWNWLKLINYTLVFGFKPRDVHTPFRLEIGRKIEARSGVNRWMSLHWDSSYLIIKVIRHVYLQCSSMRINQMHFVCYG